MITTPVIISKSVEEAMQSYLDWEIALMDKLDKDGTVAFKTA